jgi:predicted glycosyltransferase
MITALLYVQHLLGIGHLMRAGALARGLEAAGIRVVLVSGGMPVPVLDTGAARFEQLPPVRAMDETFKQLAKENGEPVDDDWKVQRRERLLQIFDREKPDILLTELYPFGRRQMRFELEPLVARALLRREQTGGPVIAASIRDIIVASRKPGRTEEIIDRVRRCYDLVLVHGDENVIPFNRSFPGAGDIADIVRSTGYVVGPIPPRQGPGAPGYDEVIVSTGGGAVGDRLLEAAVGARELCRLRERTWRVLVGHNYPEDAFLESRARAPRGVQMERARGDFTQLLANCALSISQGGYNTVAEILATGTRSVCLPFAGGEETEQTLRCRLLAERGALHFVEQDAVSADQVAMAVDRALESQPIQGQTVDTDGAARSAALLLEAVAARHAQGARREHSS